MRRAGRPGTTYCTAGAQQALNDSWVALNDSWAAQNASRAPQNDSLAVQNEPHCIQNRLAGLPNDPAEWHNGNSIQGFPHFSRFHENKRKDNKMKPGSTPRAAGQPEFA